LCIKLLITLNHPKILTSDFREAGAKGLVKACYSDVSFTILIPLQYINNSFYILIQYTNGYGLPKKANGCAYPLGANVEGYVYYTNVEGYVLGANGHAYTKSQKLFREISNLHPHPLKKYRFPFPNRQRKTL